MQANFKIIVIAILVLIVIYMILRNRTEKIKRRRDDHRSRFRPDR